MLPRVSSKDLLQSRADLAFNSSSLEFITLVCSPVCRDCSRNSPVCWRSRDCHAALRCHVSRYYRVTSGWKSPWSSVIKNYSNYSNSFDHKVLFVFLVLLSTFLQPKAKFVSPHLINWLATSRDSKERKPLNLLWYVLSLDTWIKLVFAEQIKKCHYNYIDILIIFAKSKLEYRLK